MAMKYLVSLLMVLSTLFVEAQDFKKHLTEDEARNFYRSALYFYYSKADVKSLADLERNQVLGRLCNKVLINIMCDYLKEDGYLYMPERQVTRILAVSMMSMYVMPDSISALSSLRDEAWNLLSEQARHGMVTYKGDVYSDPNLLWSAISHESDNVVGLKITAKLTLSTVAKTGSDVPMYRIINKLSGNKDFQYFLKIKLPVIPEDYHSL